MPSKLNKLAKDELVEILRDVDSAVLVDFTGVGSGETYELRKALHEQSVTLRVVKTTLARVALEELGAEVDGDTFKGPVGMVFGADPVAAAKAITEHRRKVKRTPLKIKGGLLSRRTIGAEQVTELAQLPDREQLLGMVAGAVAAPLTAFINAQAEVIRKLLYGLKAIEDKRGGSSEAA